MGVNVDIGAMAAAGLNYFGAVQANKQNRHLANKQMRMQREMAQGQMDFQERMSNTAYQRAVQDMRSAGINPILAYNQGGGFFPSWCFCFWCICEYGKYHVGCSFFCY